MPALSKEAIAALASDAEVQQATKHFLPYLAKSQYSYFFSWMGRPIIQFPQDIIAMQEIIWDVKPDVIIETGVAHGGSAVFYASMLELLGNDGQVIAVDIDIREHNRKAIEEHPMFKRITLLEGSSTDSDIIQQIRKRITGKNSVMVTLDSNHTHEHVLRELELYSPFVTIGSYLVVYDTAIEDLDDQFFSDRPWGHGNNPKTAVYEFLKTNDRFEIDKSIHEKLLITVAPDGYLRCIK
jgi:cephalosporin hydroxylase